MWYLINLFCFLDIQFFGIKMSLCLNRIHQIYNECIKCCDLRLGLVGCD